MNYIYFNPREWSFVQTQYDTQFSNGNGFIQPNLNRQVSVERSFISDFDGGLVESLMFGGWNEAYVKVESGMLSLPPDTENCFVFWLNGGENDKSSEICQLQIAFFGNSADCYTYKLNRNYIKPLLHKQGWELYSIPFKTPATEQQVVDTRFSFIAGNAPMAVKPAKEPSFYREWADEPDEFADSRPQRHNLVFEDGWPAINMYGGERYSTEALRKKKENATQGQHRQVIHGVAENMQQMAQGLAANAKQMAKGLAQSTRQMAEMYKENAEQRRSQAEAEEWLNAFKQLEEHRKRQDELTDRQEELSERRYDLEVRFHDLQSDHLMEESVNARLETDLAETNEWDSSFPALQALDAQIPCAQDMISRKYVPIEAVEGLLDSIESQLDNVEEMFDHRENLLDELEDLLDEIEDETTEE